MHRAFRIILLLVIIAGLGWIFSPKTSNSPTNTDNDMNQEESMNSDEAQSFMNVTPIQHASAVLEWGDSVLYLDPAQGSFDGQSPADLILITDIHGDHFDPETLPALVSENTIVVVPQVVADEMPEDLKSQMVIMNNDDMQNQKGFDITAVPMYNLPESDDAYHVKGRGNGYVLEQNGKRVYVAGDTEDIEEMRTLENIDVAFVPMNLPYTMTVESAAEGVLAFAPAVVYPYHYRGPDGLSDVEEFQRLVQEGNPEITVVLGNWYPEQ